MHLLSGLSQSPDGKSGDRDHDPGHQMHHPVARYIDLGHWMPSGERDHPVEQGHPVTEIIR